ncbi:MAG: helix-turn-helix transcriptional regulator [Acidimicrobiales bacterium]
MMGMEYVGVKELAQLLGLGEEQVDQLTGDDGFPEPVMELASGPVWELADVEAWARATGRAPTPRDDQ